jgi:hypothetical protein
LTPTTTNDLARLSGPASGHVSKPLYTTATGILDEDEFFATATTATFSSTAPTADGDGVISRREWTVFPAPSSVSTTTRTAC